MTTTMMDMTTAMDTTTTAPTTMDTTTELWRSWNTNYNSSGLPSRPSSQTTPSLVTNLTTWYVPQPPHNLSNWLELLGGSTLHLRVGYTVDVYIPTKYSVYHYLHQKWADSTNHVFVSTWVNNIVHGLLPHTWTWHSCVVPDTSLELRTTICHMETGDLYQMVFQHRFEMFWNLVSMILYLFDLYWEWLWTHFASSG